MRTAVVLTGILSLALTVPAAAKPGGNGKGQAKHEHIGKQGHGKASAGDRVRRDSAGERYRDGDRYRDGRYAGDGRACPPGLAKKGNGCLPPGQAKKRFAVGDRLPASYSYYNLPEQYRDDYRDTADDLYRYSDGYAYRIDRRTRVVEEVIRLLGL